MINRAIIVFCLCLVFSVFASPLAAEKATLEEARTVANNWVVLVIQLKGNWGNYERAEAAEATELTRGGRTLGYYFHVKPQGFIVVPALKELGPVKAYSTSNDLDPASDEGMADIIKGGLDRTFRAIEKKVGPIDQVAALDLAKTLEIKGRPDWDRFAVPTSTFLEGLEFGQDTLNYQAGQVLLSSHWHQSPPYNEQCPVKNCDPGCDNRTRAAVGCTATAGAQTMRYWAWPPYGSDGPQDHASDWPNMLDRYFCVDNGVSIWFEDEEGNVCTQAQVDAVAKLCHEVGVEAGMEYHCDESGACFASCLGKDLLDTFEDHYRYNTAADNKYRDDYSATGWFDLIKSQLNKNRPVPYCVEGHVIVADGWQEIGDTKQYHMNYGWGGDATDTWYTLDDLPLGGIGEEKLITQLYPSTALGTTFSGTYACNSGFPYRYFDQDATGTDATFSEGHFLQFLHGVAVTAEASSYIHFLGSGTAPTSLFSRGDTTRGIRISGMSGGEVRLSDNGSIRLH